MEKKNLEKVINALKTIRAPLAQVEYDLHQIVAQTLDLEGIYYKHEVSLGPRCRIDFLVEEGIGIELKKGSPNQKQMKAQALKYAHFEEVKTLIILVEKWVELPKVLAGKPIHTLSINRLWGIALS